MLAGEGWDRLARSLSRRSTLWFRSAALALLLVLAALTWRRLGVWRDGVTLWTMYSRTILDPRWRCGIVVRPSPRHGETDRALADYGAPSV